MASWTLWQPLIPRYQLTTKEVIVEDINGNTRPRSTPSSPPVRGPNLNSVPQSPRTRHIGSGDPFKRGQSDNMGDYDASLVRGTGHQQGKARMYFTMASPIEIQHGDSKGVLVKPAFPSRRSPYIDNFKQQQRINSARQSLEDPSTASPRHRTKSPRQRTHRTTKSQFPVTQIINHQDLNQYSCYDIKITEQQRPNTAVTQSTPRKGTPMAPTTKRATCKSAGPIREAKNLSVSTIHPFETNHKPFLKNPLYKDTSSPRRYAVRKLDDATMFIDDDKIIFIKKKTTRNDVLMCQNSTDEMNYIKHLRRLYLREPRDLAKFTEEHVFKKKNVIRERLEYELKTDHILNYYSRVDDKHDASLWAMAVEESRKDCTPYTTPRSASGPRKTESSQRRQSILMTSPPRSARGRDRDRKEERPLSARSLTHSESAHMNHDSLSDWNVFLKINSQSTLHERQFYLQTPINSVNNSKEQLNKNGASCDDHECRMCRLEREMGAQVNATELPVNERENYNICVNSTELENTPSVQTSGEDDNIPKEKTHQDTRKCENLEEIEVTNKPNKPEVRTIATSTDDDSIMKPADSSEELPRIPKTINVNLQLSINESELEKSVEHDAHNATISQIAPPSQDRTNQNISYDIQSTSEESRRGYEANFNDERGKLLEGRIT